MKRQLNTRRSLLLATALSPVLAACNARSKEAPLVAMDMTVVKADLLSLSQARILFAHQSVGRNILDGVRDLARDSGVTLRIERLEEGAAAPAGAGLFDVQLGSNGDPDTKIAAFARLLGGAPQAAQGGFDVAMLKLCYEDVGRRAKGQRGLPDRYAAMVSRLGAVQPATRVIPVTAPLRAEPASWKTPLKRLLGRETEEDADNALRNAYNQQLLARLAQGGHGTLVFDLARAESTRPDGSRSSFTYNGSPVHTLAAAYTDDGGHLNPAGRRQVAAEFVHVLALALRQPTH